MEIIKIGYVIGFFIYLLKFATETYESTNEDTGIRIFWVVLMTISVGIFYAIFWPIVWLLEWNNEQNQELKAKINEARRNDK